MYHYFNSNGSSLTSSSTAYIDGAYYYVFTVKKAVSYKNSSGTTKGTLAAGVQIATNSSTTGQTYGDHMIFYRKRSSSSGTWGNLVTGASYGFVDLGLNLGATPSDRAIY